MKRFMNYLLILLIVVMANGELFAQEIYTSGSVETKDGELVYKVNSLQQNEVKFHQIGSKLPVVTTLEDKKPEAVVSKDVPGINKKGYSHLTIQRIDDNRILIQVDQLTYENNREDQPNLLQYEATAEFINGNWAELTANHPVEIKLSEESQVNAMQVVGEWMARKIKFAADNKAPFGLMKFSADITNFIFDASRLRGSLDHLIQKINTVAFFELSKL